jgi:adenosylhomocysteine nucleosidase
MVTIMKILLTFASKDEASSFILGQPQLAGFLASDEDCVTFLWQNGDESEPKHTVMLAITGIGKVSAAHNVTKAIVAFNPDLVINAGFAGGATEVAKKESIVYCTNFVYGDVDVSHFGYKLGQLPSMPQNYTFTSAISKGVTLEATTMSKGITLGTAVTFDSFITYTPELSEYLEKGQEPILAIDMESCAIAQVCKLEGKDFFAIKVISDDTNDGSAVDYQTALKSMTEKLAIEVNKVFSILSANFAGNTSGM